MSSYELQSVPERCNGCSAPGGELRKLDDQIVTRVQLQHSRWLRGESLARSERMIGLIIDMGLEKDADIERLEAVKQASTKCVKETTTDLAGFDERRDFYMQRYADAIDSQVQDCPGRIAGQTGCNRPTTGHAASKLVLAQLDDFQLCRAPAEQ